MSTPCYCLLMTTATAPTSAQQLIASTRATLSANVTAAHEAWSAAANAGAPAAERDLARQAFLAAMAASDAYLAALGLGD